MAKAAAISAKQETRKAEARAAANVELQAKQEAAKAERQAKKEAAKIELLAAKQAARLAREEKKKARAREQAKRKYARKKTKSAAKDDDEAEEHELSIPEALPGRGCGFSLHQLAEDSEEGVLEFFALHDMNVRNDLEKKWMPLDYPWKVARSLCKFDRVPLRTLVLKAFKYLITAPARYLNSSICPRCPCSTSWSTLGRKSHSISHS
jgi:hypothetical protein